MRPGAPPPRPRRAGGGGGGGRGGAAPHDGNYYDLPHIRRAAVRPVRRMRHSEVVLVNAPLDDGWRKRIRRMGIDDNTVFFAKSFLIGTGEHRNLSILTYYIGRDKTKQTAVGFGRLPLKLRRGRGGY